ncbi:hypothetical protein M9H77_33556 [Catharanthus roseus]|uniref:Uncharacterized protein n=1 Tax=Catharanthus roseus TaxID=4058 RepID=A0ACB9ZJX3_CATRO|nr:hypothetical protein M9H77_33556 [Catharanthus roseus]
MGSSSSRPDSISSSSSSSSSAAAAAAKPSGGHGSRLKRTKHKLSSFLICGSSTSRSVLQIEDCPQESPVSSAINLAPDTDSSWNSIAESSSSFDSEITSTSSKLGTGSSSTSSNSTTQKTLLPTINREASGMQTYLSNDRELAFQPSQNLVSPNASSVDADVSGREDMPLIGSENENTSSLTLDHLNSHPDVDCEENNEVAVLGSEIPRPPTASPFALTNFHVSGDGNSEMAVPSSSGLYTSESDNMGRGDALHVDVVSIASNTLSSTTGEINSRETRRSNRRLFWDAVSRHGSRRSSDFPTIVFATGYAEDLGSHDRWLLDLSGDFHDDGVGYQSRYLSSRSRLRSAQRWLLRSEISERVLRGNGERGRDSAFCASGLHPHGTCSCESFFSAEESGTLASISRIILLAEALFEVLDEIHQQPFLSSLSMLTLPAPESTVDSFPLKYHKRSEAGESSPSEMPQCYICLAEYDDGDKLRVLPCHHEFHMSCVDKWLKEINRVCPLCRSNVCEGPANESVPTTD